MWMEIDNFSVIYTTQLCPKLSRKKKKRVKNAGVYYGSIEMDPTDMI